ncbi:related to short-chain alcohol dehydrogenase [Rhynchosporium agropyri]|uniref:Related to short-chain alcohol dehydrogenase n=2 Tax=Rhynchosporium TaxID=38037 RepID=A0A1E1M6N1_RHYSE|nr:related to short-chain alcohol dehydrogenase [Rhynchosporium agropyri]CZT44285.1 related to short-chain alcohol dehydrogenase [Rhynchosporium secalis]
MPKDNSNVVEAIRQSPPLILGPYDPAGVTGKTIIITGGASGFGEGFSRHWAAHGANIVIADISNGNPLVDEIRKAGGNALYVRCDVTNWQQQVDMFRAAVKFSPRGTIDAVVCNAGITDTGNQFFEPKGMNMEEPPKPNFKALDVNLTGVMYTTHLAMHWLPLNEKPKQSSGEKAGRYTPDRHILLIGSMASLLPIPGLVQYAASKHAVLGLFRSLRSTSFVQGIRVNLLCPYFIDTPLIPPIARALLAGGAMGKPDDVVDAGTRLMANNSIHGRALVIGPSVKIDGEWKLLPESTPDVENHAVWEVLGSDFIEVDAFTRRFVSVLNAVERVRGWYGWGYDLLKMFAYPITSRMAK